MCPFVKLTIGTHFGVLCPVEFSDFERLTHVTEAEEWQQAEDARATLQARLSVEEDGWVENEHYTAAIAANGALKRQFMEVRGTNLFGPSVPLVRYFPKPVTDFL